MLFELPQYFSGKEERRISCFVLLLIKISLSRKWECVLETHKESDQYNLELEGNIETHAD